MDDFTKKENALIALGFAILMVQLILTLLDSLGVMSKDNSDLFPIERCFLVGAGFTAVAILLFKIGSKSNFIVLFFLFGAKYFMMPSLDTKWFILVTLLTIAVMVICNLDRFDDRKRAIAIFLIPVLFAVQDLLYLIDGNMDVVNAMHVVLVICCLGLIWFLLNGKLNRQSEAQ